MDVAGAKFVGLVDKKIENFFGGNCIEGFGNFGESRRITFASDFNVVVMDLHGWVVAKHEDFVGGIGNKVKNSTFAFVLVFFGKLGYNAAGSLACDHK